MQGRCNKCGLSITSLRSSVECPKCRGAVKQEAPTVRPKIIHSQPWPLWVSSIAMFSKPSDKGVGDTAQRIAAKFGGEYFKSFARKVGMPCRCTDRQEAWNRDYPYAKKIGVIAVTSLSPREQHAKSQERAITSWIRHGLDIVSVNTSQEVSSLKDRFTQVEWIINDEEVEWGSGRKTQPIRRLAQVAIDRQQPIFIVNSDIEVHGEPKALLENMPNGKVTLGVRWNYEHNYSASEEFQWGFDVIGLTPEHAAKIPDSCTYGIGQPVWDYAVPMLMSDEFNVIHEPLFFHKKHPLNWDDKAWKEGAELFSKWFGEINHENTAEWRQRFEPDMIYEKDHYVHRPGCSVV